MSNFRNSNYQTGQNFGNKSLTVNLTETYTTINVGDFGIINLYSDSTVAVDRQINISSGLIDGQIVTFNFLSYSPSPPYPTALFSTTANSYLRINSNWQPIQYDQIVLIWNSQLWIEMGRFAYADNKPTLITAYSNKWGSAAYVTSFGNHTYAIMTGSFTSLDDSNDDPMGVFPLGYKGGFSIPGLMDSGGTITSIDIGTGAQVFGSSTTFADGDTVDLTGVVYKIFPDAV